MLRLTVLQLFLVSAKGEVFDIMGVDTLPVVLVHGGAGTIPAEWVDEKLEGMKAAVRAGWSTLNKNWNVLDAAIAAVKVMEDDPSFNAGRGSRLTIHGKVEMDAAVMSGEKMAAGGVGCISGVRHPIEAARAVMENSSHVLLVGEGANKFAIMSGLEPADDDWLITQRSKDLLEEYLREHNISHLEREELWAWKGLGQAEGHGTVGAVVVDNHGNLAAATSTGGLTGKLPGRVGDSPLVGHGVFADSNSVAVSCTGVGEAFMKAGVARRIARSVEDGSTPQDSAVEALEYMRTRVGGDGGAIVLDREGNIGIHWNSEQMGWAYAREGQIHSGVNKGDHFIEPL